MSETKRDILKLLKDYHHYKFMSSGFFGIFKGWGMGMNLCDFMLWLESKDESPELLGKGGVE